LKYFENFGYVVKIPKSFGRTEPQNKKGGFIAGRRTKFAPVKSLDSSEFSSEFSDLKTLSSDVKVNPVIS